MIKENCIVYIVDNDISALRGLGNLLTAAGYGVESFSSYEKFNLTQPVDSESCLIMDADTGGFSSDDFLNNFFQRTKSLPLIIISSGDKNEYRRKALAVKAAGFFRKPVDGPALLDAIYWALETHNNFTGIDVE